MGEKRSWWQVNKRFIITLVTIAFLIVLIKLILIGYGYDWTGFNGKDKSGKTLYDWLQLLIVPVVLAIGGYLFSLTLNRNERKAADKHNQTEREIAQDNQREAALQAYINEMSELLLHDNLRKSKKSEKNGEVSSIARVRTLRVLPRLDPHRKGNVLQFLYESSLINLDVNDGIVDLKDADLSGAILTYASLSDNYIPGNIALGKAWMSKYDARINLQKVKLSGVILDGAILHGARLCEADLSGAYLSKVNLIETNLHKANLQGAILRSTLLQSADLTEANLNDVAGITVEEHLSKEQPCLMVIYIRSQL